MGRLKIGLWLFVSLSGLNTVALAATEKGCSPGVPLTTEEYEDLLNKLRISKAGQTLIEDYKNKYGTTTNLKLFWNNVSYSEMPSQTLLCIHLARKLPEIEHIADLAHELTHATRLSQSVLDGDVKDAAQFVQERLEAKGGEADAFASECMVKHDLLGNWDHLCAGYVSTFGDRIDHSRVVEDLYSGQLSASMTGEPYPTLLARQFRALSTKRTVATVPKKLEKRRSLQ